VLEAYSRLKPLLDERGMSRAELARRIAAQDQPYNVKALYRLADPDRPLERIDLRIVGAVCRALEVGLDDLIEFAEPGRLTLRSLPEDQQQRLQDLMGRHNGGQLSHEEVDELRGLVKEAEAISRGNARRLAAHRRLLKEELSEEKVADKVVDKTGAAV
jgi:DNA-binding Xre family transcriptional regulator